MAISSADMDSIWSSSPSSTAIAAAGGGDDEDIAWSEVGTGRLEAAAASNLGEKKLDGEAAAAASIFLLWGLLNLCWKKKMKKRVGSVR